MRMSTRSSIHRMENTDDVLYQIKKERRRNDTHRAERRILTSKKKNQIDGQIGESWPSTEVDFEL